MKSMNQPSVILREKFSHFGLFLFILHPYGGPQSHSPTYDGNGNVTALVRIDDIASKAGDLSGRYEYDPYSNELAMPVSASEIFESDYAAGENPFRFGTKYKDIWIGHYYFGYRYYNPSTGNWLSRDPIEEQGGSNLYGYVGNEPVGRVDYNGLYLARLHKDKTTEWALGVGYPSIAADQAGVWNDAVDGTAVSWGPGWLPILGDQSYHFNTDFSGGRDTRLVHFAEHLHEAKKYCNWVNQKKDMPEEAVKHLGISLHPLQDWVAHGDYGRIDQSPADGIWIHHNSYSLQTPFPGKPDLALYPEDENLDAVGSPDGRPAGAAILTYKTMTWGGGPFLVDYAIYTHGRRRYNLVENLTTDALASFREYVKEFSSPGCKCYEYFGIR